MKIYRGFPDRLHHGVPDWVEDGAIFHIRIAIDREQQQAALTTPELAVAILNSVRIYQEQFRWHVTIFMLMPDHLHALVSFPQGGAMSTVVGSWKRFNARKNGILWQEGYFDHRLRNDERGEQSLQKSLTSDAILWPLDYAPGPRIGHGCTLDTNSLVDRALRARC